VRELIANFLADYVILNGQMAFIGLLIGLLATCLSAIAERIKSRGLDRTAEAMGVVAFILIAAPIYGFLFLLLGAPIIDLFNN